MFTKSELWVWGLALFLIMGASTSVLAMTARELEDDSPNQRRWLSMPESRIVLNPYNFWTTMTPAEYSNGLHLPLNVGYYASGNVYELPNLIGVIARGSEEQVPETFVHEKGSDWADWTPEKGLRADTSGSELRLTITGEGERWGALEKWVEIDLDEFPYLEISIGETKGQWALKVNDGTKEVDTYIQQDTTKKGAFVYNIPDATGWKGKKKFLVRVFSIGIDQPTIVNRLSFVGRADGLGQATHYETSWLPYELPFKAFYGETSVLEGSDYLYDESTIVRRMILKQAPTSNTQLSCIGQYDGKIDWDSQTKTLAVETDHYRYAIGFSALVDPDISYYPSLNAILSDRGRQDTPGKQGFWQLDLSIGKSVEGTEVAIIVSFTAKHENPMLAIAKTRLAIGFMDWEEKRQEAMDFWDDYLSKVPRPDNFTLVGVPHYDVSSLEIEKDYYRAWVFLASNILPAMEETGFAYPQVCAGKPSMWAEGAQEARFSASWESLFGMQFYAYVDPKTAREAFRGLMSLVDETGMLAGESLPSRKAQTAMVIHQLSDDEQILIDTYPALKRYLLWRRDNPRWIHKEHNFPEMKDSEFVVSAIVDMGYMAEIASLLGLGDDEVSFWHQQRAKLFEDYLDWFWVTPFAEPVQYYNTLNDQRSLGNPLWTSTGLRLEMLEGPYLDSLLRRLRGAFDPVGVFNGFAYPKYPDISFTVYGLLDRGYTEEAQIIINTAIRDITRANMFSEQYHEYNWPEPTGVRPSLFGACMLIDMLWLKNGYRMDLGTPHVINTGETGGLKGLTICEDTLDVSIDQGKVLVSGGYIEKTLDAAQLKFELEPGKSRAIR
ncbi:MAG: hypothetical protein PHV61_07560 [Limnochordia bacterium]|nr:hypothetical protein [Limnochordia bacterium]MDD2629995.1 hypothetical protein [Limnochordia bacterium]